MRSAAGLVLPSRLDPQPPSSCSSPRRVFRILRSAHYGKEAAEGDSAAEGPVGLYHHDPSGGSASVACSGSARSHQLREQKESSASYSGSEAFPKAQDFLCQMQARDLFMICCGAYGAVFDRELQEQVCRVCVCAGAGFQVPQELDQGAIAFKTMTFLIVSM